MHLMVLKFKKNKSRKLKCIVYHITLKTTFVWATFNPHIYILIRFYETHFIAPALAVLAVEILAQPDSIWKLRLNPTKKRQHLNIIINWAPAGRFY